jgi:AsmA family protein
MKTRKQTLLAILATFAVVIALLIYCFHWNMLRGFVERRVTSATGRSLHIRGDLEVKLSFTPRITINDVNFDNAAWSQTPTMASLSRAEVVIDLRSLFHHDIAVPLVHLVKPQLLLEKNQEGAANWEFGSDKDKPTDNGRTVRIGDLQIDEGQVTYRSAPDRADVQVSLASMDDENKTNRLLKIEARGKYLDLDTEAHGEVGAISNIADLQRAFPVKLVGHVGKTQLQADGTIDRLAHLDGLHLQFSLSGGSLADLFPLIGVPLPATPAYSFAGHLDQAEQRWYLQQLDGHVGSSDIHGNFSIDRGQHPQFMSAVLHSDNLDLKDLSGFIGARTESGKTIVHSDRVLPDKPFSFDKLNAANADIQLTGKHIQTERLPIDDMNAHLKLNDAHLVLDPLNFGVAGGDVSATINLDAKSSPIKTDADIKLKKIRFDSLFPDFKVKAIQLQRCWVRPMVRSPS